ncbi:MAG: helix-turn-helix domain-containing protein [Candidatus Micrarchaeota archaeon]
MEKANIYCGQVICPVFPMLDALEKKWALKIMREIFEGNTHFNQIKRNLREITAAVLSKRLKELEDEGLVLRKILSRGPSEIEYELGAGAQQLMDCWQIHEHGNRGK